jgi:BMFP domain-containing protein YqiC
MLSQGTIYRIYAQGEEAIVRLITRLEDRIADLEAQLTRSPQPLIASLSKELARAKRTLVRQTDQLLLVRQQNHQLVRRIRELEREIESGGSPVEKDSTTTDISPFLPENFCRLGLHFVLNQRQHLATVFCIFTTSFVVGVAARTCVAHL